MDMLRTGTGFVQSAEILESQDLLAVRMNASLKIIDPQFYANAEKVHDRMNQENAGARMIGGMDPLVLEGREYLVNSRAPIHIDKQDTPLGWVGIVALGYFTGGFIYLASLGLRVRMQPGDCIWLRGRVLTHGVEEWEGTLRISIPHFTHASVWRKYGMADEAGLKPSEPSTPKPKPGTYKPKGSTYKCKAGIKKCT
ncbi:uncharacterized protein LAESUDRAFT_690258 [Laetiporus sulphureus 93-53]|uniref:Uncharacterized protein n=1 Tax=Laetiporus sulphureus 93-53 TaxID=1314785 RepID=A0A165IHR7_9APHY|nr:uncharacterized protein LAESUDRAFT_690258 [Laetiporus sulphureus 93-53]KZT13090.1 hypothetical protein LAESUDRAFT_690258 [Laetiporus sulphureus 93-53]